MELDVLLKRDFDEQPYIPKDSIIYNTIHAISMEFINFDDFNKTIDPTKNHKIILVDTCYIIKNSIEQFTQDEGNIYVFTCGVFLEILQGATKKTIENGEFLNDLKKILQIKKKLNNGCVFLTLGRKRRAYWANCEPSKSCRNCINTDQPHYKILRDVDTELFRLTTVMKCQIKSFDNYLLRRVSYHSKI
jgi:hypothetical protein